MSRPAEEKLVQTLWADARMVWTFLQPREGTPRFSHNRDCNAGLAHRSTEQVQGVCADILVSTATAATTVFIPAIRIGYSSRR
jgi:hypothetical protein